MTLNHPTVLKSVWVRDNVFCIQYKKLISQSSLSGRGYSNACVMISLTTCLFYHRGLLQHRTIYTYPEVIKRGNHIYYSVVPKNRCSANLYVEEGIEFSGITLEIVSDMPFFDYTNMSGHILKDAGELLGQQCINLTYVLILPPDKAMAVLVGDDEIAVFDSHRHGPSGALIMIAKLSDTADLMEALQNILLSAFAVKSFAGCFLTRVRPTEGTAID